MAKGVAGPSAFEYCKACAVMSAPAQDPSSPRPSSPAPSAPPSPGEEGEVSQRRKTERETGENAPAGTPLPVRGVRRGRERGRGEGLRVGAPPGFRLPLRVRRNRLRLADGDGHRVDAVVLDFQDVDGDRPDLDLVAHGGIAPELGKDDAADRALVAVAELHLQLHLQILHQHAARNPVDAVAERLDLWFLDVELVLNRADDLLDDVFEGDDAGDAAVLVDHGGEV